jgi:hypothetical protein
MDEMLDCLVTYYSVSAHRDGMPLQYLCYRIVSGPGPTAAGGVAVISLLGAKNPNERELYHNLHAVQDGGPRAALEAALNYLDAVHYSDDLARAQTEVRCTPCVPPMAGEHDHAIESPRSPPGGRRRRGPDDQGITVLRT